jgi:phosphomevalonate kinase
MKIRKRLEDNKKQGKTCEKKNWSEAHLDKECKIAIDTDDVRVMSADGALFKINQKTQEGKLLFYYRLPSFSLDTKNQDKMLLRATVEVRMSLKTMTTIADSINKQFSAIQKQTSLHKSMESDPHIMFG